VCESLPITPGEGARSRALQPSGPLLVVSLFGGISLRLDGREIALANRKARALLGYLALAPNLSETRERLVGMLWSESDEERARASLRQTLYGLRDALAQAGFAGLVTDRNEVALEAGSISLDVAAVLDSVTAGIPHDLLLDRQRLTDSLMAGFEEIDPSFRIWLLAKRQFFHERIVHALQGVLRGDGRASSSGTHERTARALLNLDPTHEEAARALIGARAANGDIGGALGIYKTLWDLLEDEYDTEPSKPTQELIARIRLEQPFDSRSVTVPPAVDAQHLPNPEGRADAERRIVVAVGEFDASATRPEQRYLVQGFRRELIACLVRFREWLVRERQSNPGGLPSSEDARGEFVVEASAFQVADGVRLVLMLREGATDVYLWSERFQISLTSWFDAQQTIVRRLAAALNVYVSAERMAAVGHRRVGDLKAYDLWLQGQTTILGLDPKRWHQASDMFREVSRQMPDFAPARSSLAQLHNMIHFALPGVKRNAQRTAQALEHAREAARLDPIDSRSQLSLAWSYAMSNQHEQAAIHLQLALELNDNDPWTLTSSAACLAFCGAIDRARDLADDALRVPFTFNQLQWAYHAGIRFFCADYERCLQAAQLSEAILTSPGYKVSALFHMGRRNTAADELKSFFRVARERWVGDEPASDANITRWFLDIFPVRCPEDWERLRDGLGGAGAPVQGLTLSGAASSAEAD
jgi:DNA-binding SARP family transcriptional activator